MTERRRTAAELEALLAERDARLAERERDVARLAVELQQSSASLTEALAQQTATSEVVATISRSPTDLQGVLDAIADSAARLCGTDQALIALREGDGLRRVAGMNRLGERFTIAEPEAGTPAPMSLARRAMAERRVIHVPDVAATSPDDVPAPIARQGGVRSMLVVPLVRAGEGIGAILVSLTELRPFTDAQIALVRTFADQAVIAIENSRLFSELQERLAEQIATAEVLASIGRSPTELQRVLDTIVESAQRLCRTDFAIILLEQSGHLLPVAGRHLGGGQFTLAAPGPRRPVERTALPAARAVLDRRVVHVEDLAAVPTEEYVAEGLRRVGVRTELTVPLLVGDRAVGVLALPRREVRPFTDREIALVQTFADQAAIAIQNARLFQELQERLAEQTATAEVLRVISESPTDVGPVLEVVCEQAMGVCGADDVVVYAIEGDQIVPRGARGPFAAQPGGRRLEPGMIGWDAVRERRAVQVADLLGPDGDPYPISRQFAESTGNRGALTAPMMAGGRPIGLILIRRGEALPWTDRQVRLLEGFANQAAIAIENARLFQELNESNDSLREALEQQTATAQVLEVISRSPTDLQTVLDTIAASAARLCGTEDASLLMILDGGVRAVAGLRPAARPEERVRRSLAAPGPPIPLDRNHNTTVRAIVDGRVIHVHDILTVVGEYTGQTGSMGVRTALSVPLLREGAALGAIALARYEVRPFTEQQVALVKTFADQAVIAIENSRLFSELQERLEEQTATAEVLRVISESPTDLARVLDSIAERAQHVCRGRDAIVWLREGDEVVRTAVRGIAGAPPGFRSTFGRGSGLGRAMVDRQTVCLPDLRALDPAEWYGPWLSANVREGARAYVAVPLLRLGGAVGVIVVRSDVPEGFSERQIALLTTFADQAVIAVENSRLFRELQERNEDLAGSLAHERAVGEILQVINASTTDVQPVFQAVVEHAETLLDDAGASLWLYRGDRSVGTAWGPAAIAALPAPIETFRTDVAVEPRTMPGRVYLEKRTVHLHDALAHADPTDPEHDWPALEYGLRTVLGVPLWREGAVTGLIIVYRNVARPFTDREIALVETFARQAAIALANAELFRALQERTAELTASVERLTALSEVSGAVSATLDLDRVLQAVVQRAAGLAGAEAGTIYVFDPEAGVFEPRANHGLPDDLTEALRAARIRVGETPVGQAAAARAPVQVPDLEADRGDTAAARALTEAGFRSLLAVPLLREQDIVGALVVRRKATGEFAASTVELLQTFAAQSALAIQNARLFQELAVKSAQLEDASRHKSEFLANMSHELRTPLNAIIGFTEVLLERYFGEVNEKQEDYLKDVLSSGQHLLALINDILDLSKVEAGRMELELGTFDLGHVLDAGLVMVKERASKKGIELTLAVGEDVGRVEADERKVKQVVFNLLTNAVKFTPDGGKVSVSALWRDGWVEVAVADTGVGIAAEDLGRVFEEFGQAKNQQGQTEGTGLGLALVKRYVELHEGTVSVESAVGKGSTFAFTVPVKQRVPA